MIRQNEMNRLFGLENRVALVTGAAGHLGSEMSNALALSGATVLLNGRNEDNLNLLKDSIEQKGGSAAVLSGDISQEEEVKAIMEVIAAQYGRLDVIVNNAYSGGCRVFEESSEEEFMQAYKIAVVAAFHIIKYAKPLLQEAVKTRGGTASIINISSMYGMVSPDHSIYGDSKQNSPPFYGVAKAGLMQLTKYAACELAEDKIRVNCISPGPFPAADLPKENPNFYQKLCQRNPMRRVGRADELQGPLLFLASDASSFVTGSNLVVDGGWTAW